MNLLRAQKALLAVQRNEARRLRVHRAENEADVREIVQAGLLNAELSDGSSQSVTVLGSLTSSGRRFLRVFPARYRFCAAC